MAMLIDCSDNIVNLISLFLKQYFLFEFPHISWEFGKSCLFLLLHRSIWWSVDLHSFIIWLALLHDPTCIRYSSWFWWPSSLIACESIGLISFHGKLVCQRCPASSLAEKIRWLTWWNYGRWMLEGFGRNLPKIGCRLRWDIATRHYIRTWSRRIAYRCEWTWTAEWWHLRISCYRLCSNCKLIRSRQRFKILK
jgi:hypothetical protein